jgi:hypothetical protein
LFVLFNFLVALVDQSFSEVVSNDKVSYYQSRAYRNSEYLNFQKITGKYLFPSFKLPSVDYLVCSTTVDDVEMDEYLGLIKTIRSLFQK